MKGVLEMMEEIRVLGKVIASHATTDGIRFYINVGSKQIVRVDVKLDAKKEVEGLLRAYPYFASSVKKS